MGEFEEKLNAILGNQEAMGQIMALAQSLSGKEGQSADGIPQAQEPDDGPGRDSPRPPEEGESPAASSPLQELDPRLIQLGVRLMQEYNSRDDRSAALLEALRHFLRRERYARVDRAVQIARLSRVIRVLFDVMRENGGSFHV